jgi:thiosulfate/3-mercaptopyruvate sulfurtransferase
VLSRSGISQSSTIVLYGYGAYLGFWLMKCYRHDHVLWMDGPRGRWDRTGHQWSVEPGLTTASSYALPAADLALIASRDVVEQRVGQPDAMILDVRSEAEFAGERFWPCGATEDAGRAGHIPAAVHISSDPVHDEDGALRSPEELRALFETSGVGSDRRVLTYCTIGNRASRVWFALIYVLGHHDVSVYYGSWAEWGKLASTPIETSCAVSKMALQRPTFSRIESVEAVHTNGLGSSLWALRYSSIAATRSGTLWNTPRRMALSVSSLNHRSTRFSHELEVGVTCR